MKKYQIFISSTYTDLIEARKMAIETILKAYHLPVGMEMFSADDDEQWQVIKDTIDTSDYYIVIIGHRYGSQTAEGISYTEKEFDYAKTINLPILSFIRDRGAPTTASERDDHPEDIKKLNHFISKAKADKLCDFWKTPDELVSKITVALMKMFQKKPGVGWVRANSDLHEKNGRTPLSPLNCYKNLEHAKADIREACKRAKDIKILANKGLVFFGLDESIISLAEATKYSDLKRLRVILLSPESRWVNRGLMALRQYESLADLKEELKSSGEIMETGMKKFANRLNLSKSGIKYHRSEPHFRVVLTEELAFVSSYAESPSDQVRDLPVYAFKNNKGSLYGAIHRQFNDLWHNHSDPGSYLEKTVEAEISAGGVLLAKANNQIFVVLVSRDDGSWVLPKGHKQRADMNLEVTAIREVSEETGVQSCNINIIKQIDEYSFDEIAEENHSKKVVYLYLMEYIGESLAKLKPDTDHVDAKWWSITENLPFMRYAYQRTLLAEVIANEYKITVNFG